MSMDLKKYNVIIPSYIKRLSKDNRGFYLCPKCNKPLTYLENTDHIECDYCEEIHGSLSLIMFNENNTLSEAIKEAEEIMKTTDLSQVAPFSEADKRLLGTKYFNNADLLSIYATDYINKPLIFADLETAELIYFILISFFSKNGVSKKDLPNIIGIKHAKYVFNALTILKNMKNNHHIKIFIITENDANGNNIKKKLIADLEKFNFSNYRIPELINFNLNRHKITDEYNKNKDFDYWLYSTINNFNALRKPILTTKEKETVKLLIKPLTSL